MYDPTLGRFLQKDPLPFVQRYAYAGDNPSNLSDPSGMCWGPRRLCTAGHAIVNATSAANDIGVAASIQFDSALNNIPGLDSPVAQVIDRGLKTAGDTELGLLERLKTPQCLSAALDFGGWAAIEVGGPFGVPLAAAAFTASFSISIKEQDFVGGAFNSAAWATTPLGFAKFSPGLHLIAESGGQAAFAYSAANCAVSALK